MAHELSSVELHQSELSVFFFSHLASVDREQGRPCVQYPIPVTSFGEHHSTSDTHGVLVAELAATLVDSCILLSPDVLAAVVHAKSRANSAFLSLPSHYVRVCATV